MKAKNKSKGEKVLICVICGNDFERTKYILNTVVAQTYRKYEILVLGKKSDIVSFEEMFEIINYSDKKVDINFRLPEECSDLDYIKYAQEIAQNDACDYVCILPRGVAFYDGSSLEGMMKMSDLDNSIHSFSSLNVNSSSSFDYFNIQPFIFKPSAIKKNSHTYGQFNCEFSEQKQIIDKAKVKIVIFVTSYSIWTSMKTLYEAAIKRNNLDVKLVHIHNSHINANEDIVTKEISTFKSNGYEVIPSEEYDLNNDRPDIVFYGLPYSTVEKRFTIDHVSQIVPRCIYVPYGFKLDTSWEELIRLRYKVAMIYLAWIVFYGDESELQFAKKHIYGDGSNLAAVGLPRMDLIRTLTKDSYPEYSTSIFNRARGRKIALWNTHHSINSEKRSFSSWKQMGQQMVEYIKGNSDVFFLWRPHPYFREALSKYMGEKESHEFWKEIDKVENIYVDEEQTYLPAFSIADLMVSDASSLAKEYLYTGNPVIVTASAEGIIDNIHPFDCMEIYTDIESVISAIDRIKNGNDIKRSARKKYLASILKSDSSVGETMLNYIMTKYEKETMSCSK